VAWGDPSEKGKGQMARILVVDDDAELAASVMAVLESNGHTVARAANGTEGEAIARKTRPDLLVMDVMMAHDSEGFEVARKLHQDPAMKDMPVLILTGIRRAKNLPFKFEPDEDWLPVKAVLEKPVKPEVLLKAVDQALGKAD
jgi:CheY-like chemotaxis protein